MNLKVNGKRIIDEAGRERIYNGINLVFKGIDNPSVPGGRKYIREFQKEDFAQLKRKGINLIRFGIVWDAIEHEIGKYNEAYLDWVEDVLDCYKDNGIQVFLDMHQDLYSRIFGGGAPEWATLTDGASHIETDLWSDAYLFSDAVNTAYRNFWLNKKTKSGKGLQEHYSELWQHVIDRLGSHEAIIGYDFINEPFPGENSLEILGSMLMAYSSLTEQNKSPEELLNEFQDEELKFKLLQDIDNSELYTAMTETGKPLVAVFDKGHLTQFYNRMAKALRDKTKKGLVFTENSYFSNMGIESSIQKITVDGVIESLQIYSPHGYDLVVDTPAVVMASNNRITSILDAHKRVQERLDVPVVFGEWGAHGRYEEGLLHIEYILNYFDANKWSHTYYCWQDDIINYPVMKVLSRPYPQAIAGEINSYGYDFRSKVFTLSWSETIAIEAPSVIYIPTEPKEIMIEGDYNLIEYSGGGYSLEIMQTGNNKRKLTVVL